LTLLGGPETLPSSRFLAQRRINSCQKGVERPEEYPGWEELLLFRE